MERIDYYKYHKSDFRLLIDIDTKYKGEDDSIVALTTVDRFVFKFWTKDREKPYICSSTGGETPVLKNCSILDEHRVMCNFDMAETDNQQLEPGRLMLEAEFILPDTDFEGDKHNNVKRYYTTSLILTAEPDKDSEGDHTLIPLLIDCLKGDTGKSAYKQAQEGGYEGTEEEFSELLAKNAEYGALLLGWSEVPKWEDVKSEPTGVGELVIYDGKLYKFDEARAADEEWDSTKVHLTSLWAEIDAMVKSDYEQVNIELKTETGEVLPNVEVVVTVEGEEAPRNLTTDNMGKCTTNIPKGVEYTVACASVPNYYPVETVVRRASIPVRYVNFTYIEDDTVTREAVKITLTYADSTLTKATWVRVSYGGENYQLALNENNVAETSIPLGTQYTVTFEDIEGYKTPAPQTYTAQLHGTRNINVRYNAPVSGVKWLMKNGAERELNDVTNTERLNGDIFGLIVQTSDLMQAGCSYVIPLDMLLTQSATSSGQWLSSSVTVPHLQYFGSHAAALADFDGEANCLAIEQFIAEKAAEGTTYTSSMVSNCRNRVGGAERFKDTKDYAVGDYVVYRNMLHVFTSPHTAGEWVDGETESMYGYIMPDGRVRRCFQPSYAQIYAFRLLRDRVHGFTTDVFGIGCCAIASGNWWSSTQCNADNGVFLYNGGFYNLFKNYGCTLLPVLAY